MREVTMKDGASRYTLTLDDEAATLKVDGPLTAKLAAKLIEDLAPIAGARKRSAPPRQKPALSLGAVAPGAKAEGGG